MFCILSWSACKTYSQTVSQKINWKYTMDKAAGRRKELSFEERCKLLQYLERFGGIETGWLIDILNKKKEWVIGKVLTAMPNEIVVKYDKEPSKDENTVKLSSGTIATFRTHTKGYANLSKCLQKLTPPNLDHLASAQEKAEKVIESQFKCLATSFEITQYIRGELYIFVDSVLTYEGYKDKKKILSKAINFLKKVLQLIAEWFKEFPKYLKSFMEYQKLKDLMRLDRDIAFVACFPEIVEMLEWLLFQCPRTQSFFVTNDSMFKHDKEEEKKFTKTFDLTSSADKAKQKDSPPVPPVPPVPPINLNQGRIFSSLFNDFRKHHGLDAIMDILSVEKMSQKLHSLSMDSYKIPIDIPAKILAALRSVNSIASQTVLEGLWAAAKTTIEQKNKFYDIAPNSTLYLLEKPSIELLESSMKSFDAEACRSFPPESFTDNVIAYTCPICLMVPSSYEAVDHGTCGAVFCYNCIAKWLLGSDACPKCKAKNFGSRRIKEENRIVYNMMQSLMIRCTIHKNCKWTGKFEDLNKHRAEHFRHGANEAVDSHREDEEEKKSVPSSRPFNEELKIMTTKKDNENDMIGAENELKHRRLSGNISLSELNELGPCRIPTENRITIYFTLTTHGSRIGDIAVELKSQASPNAINNFLAFYNSLSWTKKKVTQISPGKFFACESGHMPVTIDSAAYPRISHNKEGILSIPKNNESVFIITLGNCVELDETHIALGFVIDGKEVLEEIGRYEGTLMSPTELLEITKPDQTMINWP